VSNTPEHSSPVYHDGMRELQDRFDTRRLADRLTERLLRTAFSEEDRAFIEGASFFFFATADAAAQPDCSYKGGLPGFVRVTGESELSFPSYDGNGMFRSLGNLRVNPRVSLLFIDFEKPRRLRVIGSAALTLEPVPAVRVRAEQIFPNCPRYIHRMKLLEHSAHAGDNPPVPAWKQMPHFNEVLPAADPARRG